MQLRSFYIQGLWFYTRTKLSNFWHLCFAIPDNRKVMKNWEKDRNCCVVPSFDYGTDQSIIQNW